MDSAWPLNTVVMDRDWSAVLVYSSGLGVGLIR